MRLIVILLAAALLCGCSLRQIRQEFIGISANDVTTSKDKQVLNFDMSGPDCIVGIKAALTEMKAIVREDAGSHFIYADNFQKAFRSTVDTTQVGIAVTWLEQNKCQVEVASDNIDLGIFVAKELDKKLKGKSI